MCPALTQLRAAGFEPSERATTKLADPRSAHPITPIDNSGLVDSFVHEAVRAAAIPTRWVIRHKGKYWGYEVFGWVHGGWSLMISAEDDELPFVREYLKKNYGVKLKDVPIVKRLSHKESLDEAANLKFVQQRFPGAQIVNTGKHGRFEVLTVLPGGENGHIHSLADYKKGDLDKDPVLDDFDIAYFANRISKVMDKMSVPKRTVSLAFAPGQASGWMYPASGSGGPIFMNRKPSSAATSKYKAWRAPRSPHTCVHEYGHLVWHNDLSSKQKEAFNTYYATQVAADKSAARKTLRAPTDYATTSAQEWYCEVLGYSMYGKTRVNSDTLEFFQNVLKGKITAPEKPKAKAISTPAPDKETTAPSPILSVLKSAVLKATLGDYAVQDRPDHTVRIIPKDKGKRKDKVLLDRAIVALGFDRHSKKPYRVRHSTGTRGGLVFYHESMEPRIEEILSRLEEDDETLQAHEYMASLQEAQGGNVRTTIEAAGFQMTTRAAEKLDETRMSTCPKCGGSYPTKGLVSRRRICPNCGVLVENMPNPEDAQKVRNALMMRSHYKFVVTFPGFRGRGVRPHYCKTEKEAEEAVKAFRKKGFKPKIKDTKDWLPESMDEATLYSKVTAALKGQNVRIVRAAADHPEWGIRVISPVRERTTIRKRLQRAGFSVKVLQDRTGLDVLPESLESVDEARAFGLPGQFRGAKAHSWFMKGHAAGLLEKPEYDTSKLSKACAGAYKAGYKKGKADRLKESVEEADYARPINPDKWGVNSFDVKPPGRGELQVQLPRGADSKLINKLRNSVDGELIVNTKKKMTWLIKTPSARKHKLEMVARVIRGWKEKSGWAEESLEETMPDSATAQKAMKAGYRFVVYDPGATGMGVDPYYAKTKKEAKEAAQSFRKMGSKPRIKDLSFFAPSESIEEVDKKAFAAGQQAQKAGANRAPISNKKFMRSITGLSDTKRKQAMKDYLRGWDAANLAEALDEGSKQIAQTILKQIGSKALYMIGAKKPYYSTESGVKFKVGKNKISANWIEVEYNRALDEYTLIFARTRGATYKVLKKVPGMYAEDLARVIGDTLGMAIQMPKVQFEGEKQCVIEGSMALIERAGFHATPRTTKCLAEVDIGTSVARLNQLAKDKGMLYDEHEGCYIIKSGTREVRFFADLSSQGRLAAAWIGPGSPRGYKKWKLARNTNPDLLWKKRINPYLDRLIIMARKDEIEG